MFELTIVYCNCIGFSQVNLPKGVVGILGYIRFLLFVGPRVIIMFAQSLLSRNRTVENLAEKARVKNPIWNYIWYFLGLPVILSFSTFIAWGDFGIRPQSMMMVVLVSILYIGVRVNRYKSYHHASYRAIGMSVFYTTVGFLAIFSILAIGRFSYSRSFLLSAYGLTVIWFLLGTIFFRMGNPRYIVIRGGLAERIRGMSKVGWKYMEKLKDRKSIQQYDGIVVDLHAHDDKKMMKALADSSLHGVPVLHVANILENYTGRSILSYLAKEGIYDLEHAKPYRKLKRVWEIGLILLLAPLIIPVVAVTTLLIKLDSRGPVLFNQKRVGKDGKLFTLYKFRSMYVQKDNSGSQFASKQDDRITGIGRFIRKFRIDELPQFWNIIKGDMSLIGPRPEQKGFVQYFDEEIPFYSYRHKIRPGITGWAQIKGGYAASLSATRKKVEYDLYYLKNISLSLDLLIVYATLRTILTGFGSR